MGILRTILALAVVLTHSNVYPMLGGGACSTALLRNFRFFNVLSAK